MDDHCRILPGKKLLNWLILAPGRVIFQEYFKSQMDVCQKFSEGKPFQDTFLDFRTRFCFKVPPFMNISKMNLSTILPFLSISTSKREFLA